VYFYAPQCIEAILLINNKKRSGPRTCLEGPRYSSIHYIFAISAHKFGLPAKSAGMA